MGFREKAEAAVVEHPGALICFFVPGSAGGGMHRVLRAAQAGERWAMIGAGGWIPVIAASWPQSLIAPFLEYASQSKFKHQRADDEVVKRFVRQHRVEVLATVPSLVEHPDVEPSLIGRQHGAGQIRWRVAALFSDD